MRLWMYIALAGLLAMGLNALPAAALEGSDVINDHSAEWDTLWAHVLIDIGVIGTILAIASGYALIVYKRKNADDVGTAKVFSFGQMMGWALIPAFIFLADDFYLAAAGWNLWNNQRTVPAEAMEVKVTASMWAWDFEYENGAASDAEEGLVVPAGKPIVLRMVSEDAVHAFFIPEFRIKEDVMPGRVTYLWFLPKAEGEHTFVCTEFCGTDHSNMWGKVKVVSQEAFDKWSADHQG